LALRGKIFGTVTDVNRRRQLDPTFTAFEKSEVNFLTSDSSFVLESWSPIQLSVTRAMGLVGLRPI
jgi:hypothetical protein